MANLGDTGNGATAVFGTSALSLAITEIQIGEITIDMLDVSLLATTDFMLEIASDLKKAPEVTLKFVFDTLATAPVVGGVPETFTVTFPLRTGEATAANLAGTIVITGFQLPELKNGTIQTGTAKVKFNGDTGPAYTKAIAS
jgi:hypothetical protein